MSKYLVTFTSANPITGAIMVTTSPRSTCPQTCPLRKDRAAGALCYAEHGHLGGFIWSGLDRTEPGRRFGNGVRVYNLKQLTTVIECLSSHFVWRHNQAGDLVADRTGSLDPAELNAIVQANCGRRGFTFTHHDVTTNIHNRALVRYANSVGFRISLSADSLAHADQLALLNVAPVAVVLAAQQKENLRTPAGRRVVICPARTRRGVTCSTCKLCTRMRDTIVGLPELTGSNSNFYRKSRA